MVQLNFDICELSNCQTITFAETTGTYDAIENPNGWGSPNSVIDDADTATLEITQPDGTITTIDLFALTPSFPTTTLTQTYSISASTAGLSTTAFTDGKYTFVYTVTGTTGGNDFTYTQTVEQLFFCQARCCVDRLFAAIDDFTCDCNKTKINEAYQADILLRSLKRAAGCGDLNSFTDTLTIINNLCGTTTLCSSCN